MQILISSWDEPASALTPERITKDTGLTVTDPQPVTLSGATGLTFKSNNPAFGGASSDAWFIAGGNIYQMSTYDLRPWCAPLGRELTLVGIISFGL